MEQAIAYAESLDVPFAFSSNGDAFLDHDRTATSGTVEREIPLDQFPTPEELWTRYRAAKAGNFNLDLKNPHNPDAGPGDVDHLLPEHERLLAQIAETREKLKAQLIVALTR